MKYKKYKRVLIISDLQIPFHHKDALAFLKAVRDKYRPDKIINIGDLTDCYCLSAYAKSPESLSPKQEIRRMLKAVKKLADLFPEMSVMKSNHDRRLYRAAARAAIPNHFLKNYNEWMQCPDTWTFHNDLEVNGILYTHGDEGGAGGQQACIKRAEKYGKSTVSGHLHTMSEIRYSANRDKVIFGMQVGCLIDREELAFSYAKTNIRKPLLSVGLVINGMPMLVPMAVVSKTGRWTGKLLGD